MLTLDGIDQVFCDGLLVDSAGQLLFMSVWGRDTALSQLLARLTLPDHPDGIDRFKVRGEGFCASVAVPNAKLLDKEQGRSPKSIFGDLMQLFVYVQSLREPDRIKREAWAVYREGDHAGEPDIWPLVMETCHVPLLPQWRSTVIAEFQNRDWLSRLTGYRMGAIGVHLGSEELEACIEELVQSGQLQLPLNAD